MEHVFDRKKQFKHLEQSTKRVVEAHYNQCLYMCNEKTEVNMS